MDSFHYNNVCGRFFSTYREEVTEDSMVTLSQRESLRPEQTVFVNASMTPGLQLIPG
jgi:hypothetical protein